ncbi:sporulation protein [Glycomyces buryatensis]|uniref:Sporulation protein n=1 Tax=Glycomyces buryatensis TaxID=2570927 RepID=A0A4S8QFF1_9ACTN|nr:sporulation protein [Glycomyces buryatensis]THV43148.1 sporulation protein [Glycomyces buryatensis]
MVFSKLKALLGAGLTVDTLLHETSVTPGGTLKGEVRISGGEADAAVERIAVAFTALIEDDAKSEDATRVDDYFTAEVSGKFDLAKGAAHSAPFEIQVPWETPFNAVEGRPLVGGMKLGVSTDLALDQAMDKGDLDWLTVEALPVHKAVWSALENLGFAFQETDLEAGTIQGATVPFYQEAEFWATGGDYAGRVKELEVTFVTGEASTDVVFQADNASELLAPDLNTTIRFSLPTADAADATEAVREQLDRLLTQKGA